MLPGQQQEQFPFANCQSSTATAWIFLFLPAAPGVAEAIRELLGVIPAAIRAVLTCSGVGIRISLITLITLLRRVEDCA